MISQFNMCHSKAASLISSLFDAVTDDVYSRWRHETNIINSCQNYKSMKIAWKPETDTY